MRLGYNAPTMVKDRFSRFEKHVERLVEGSFSRLFSGHLHPREIAVQLARAMEDNIRTDQDDLAVAPYSYTVALHPADYDAILSQQPDLADTLAAELVEMARVTGLHMPAVPDVQVVPDEDVASHRANVRANDVHEPPDATQALEALPSTEGSANSPKASLVSGEDHRVIPLDRDIINVGRNRENQIVLDGPRVSRHHAQLRLRFGRYVLFDLDSRDGTMVNGQPVQETILQHGDVISLGGVRLIYTEDDISAGDSDTGPARGLHDWDETEGHPPLASS
jgi:hypothetical protein